MPGSKSDYMEKWVLDRLGAATFAATVYIALYTAVPSDTGGGVEVAGGGYARIPVTNNPINWPAAANGQKQNGMAFSGTAAGANWGTINGMAIFDAAAGGNMLWWAPITPGIIINDGDTMTFPVGGITITEE